MVYIVIDPKTGNHVDPNLVVDKIGNNIASVDYNKDTLSVDFINHGKQFEERVRECGWRAEEYDSVRHGPHS